MTKQRLQVETLHGSEWSHNDDIHLLYTVYSQKTSKHHFRTAAFKRALQIDFQPAVVFSTEALSLFSHIWTHPLNLHPAIFPLALSECSCSRDRLPSKHWISAHASDFIFDFLCEQTKDEPFHLRLGFSGPKHRVSNRPPLLFYSRFPSWPLAAHSYTSFPLTPDYQSNINQSTCEINISCSYYWSNY